MECLVLAAALLLSADPSPARVGLDNLIDVLPGAAPRQQRQAVGPMGRAQPVNPLAPGGAGTPANATPEDYGSDLVDIIQETLQPHRWEPQGGQGVIRYWRPGRALVVRHNDEMHEQVEDLLRQLRR